MVADSKSVLFQLLHLAINGQQYPKIPSQVNWRDVMTLSLQQGVGAIAFLGLDKLASAQRPMFDLYLEWLGQCEVVEQQTRSQFDSAVKLSELWHSKGIRTMVLKGFSNAILYPDPMSRPSSDLDCFLCGKYEEGNRVVEEFGIRVNRDDYRHSTFDFEQVHVENHKICTTVRGKKQRKLFERYLQDLLITEPTNTIQDSYLEVPSRLFNAYYFLQHAHRHFLREGITLRYVCDWAMILRQDLEEAEASIFTDEFWNTCELNDLKPFVETMSRLAYHVFGIKASWLDVGGTLLKQDELFLHDCFDILNHTIEYGNSFRAHSQMVRNMVSHQWKYKYFSQDSFIWDVVSSIWGVFFEKEPIIE